MARFDHYEPCPRCTDGGRDRAGDNLAIYSDGGSHCFSCGYHRFPVGVPVRKPEVDDGAKSVLPADFTREVPARAWEWLLQYGLSWRYWTPFVGWSERESRLVITCGTPIGFSVGRFIGTPTTKGEPDETPLRQPRKWFAYGNCHANANVFGWDTDGGKTVLVEDIVSAHKVGQHTPCIPLFGTRVPAPVMTTLRHIGLPILMWLDKDQDVHSARRAAQLAMVTGLPVTYVSTNTDPKCQTISKIGEIVNK